MNIRLPEKGPIAQGRSTKFISMIEWIRTNSLSIENPLSLEPFLACRDANSPFCEGQSKSSRGVSFFFFFITLGLELSETKVYEP